MQQVPIPPLHSRGFDKSNCAHPGNIEIKSPIRPVARFFEEGVHCGRNVRCRAPGTLRHTKNLVSPAALVYNSEALFISN